MIEIIPAVDIIGGKCVRLSQGDYGKVTRYDASPSDMVKRFVDAGLTRIHAVDLDGARAGRPVNLRVLEEMAMVDGASIEWGGGLKKDGDLYSAFNAGAAYIVIGSVAVREPERFAGWLMEYGPDTMVLGADLRDGKVAVAGWTSDSETGIDELLERFLPDGLSQSIVTDISRDGMLQGPNFELYTGLQERYPDIIFTVSGGISSMDDIERAAELGLERVIVGKAIYEGRISLGELEHFITNEND